MRVNPSLLLFLFTSLLCLHATFAHVESVYANLPISADGALQILKVGHGCVGSTSPPLGTVGLTVVVPKSLKSVYAQEVPHFTSTVTANSDGSRTIDWVAESGYFIPGAFDHFQLLGIMFVIDSTKVSNGATVELPAVQHCENGAFTAWNQTGEGSGEVPGVGPSPAFIAFTPANDAAGNANLYGATAINTIVTGGSSGIDDTYKNLAIAAIVVAGVSLLVNLIFITVLSTRSTSNRSLEAELAREQDKLNQIKLTQIQPRSR
jgi:hypothetical protein